MYKVLVTGSRAWPYSREDLRGMVMFNDAIRSVLRGVDLWDEEYNTPEPGVFLIVGDCPTGLDLIARDWCAVHWVDHQVYEADWSKHGRAAGPIRNREMVSQGPDVVVAFPHPTEPSKGTSDCMIRAKNADIQVVQGQGFWPEGYSHAG